MTSYYDEDFRAGQYVRACLVDAGLNQRELGDLTELGEATISRIVTGEREIGREHFQRIVRVLPNLQPWKLLSLLGWIDAPDTSGLNPRLVTLLLELEREDLAVVQRVAERLWQASQGTPPRRG